MNLPEQQNPTPSLECADALRADLRAARFGVDPIDRLLGDAAQAALGRAQRVPARRALLPRAGDPLATLVTLFLLGDAVPAAAAEAAFPALGLAGAREGGLVALGDDGSVRATVDLRPYGFVDTVGVGEWWIASDLGELASGGALREDHVLGIGGASTTLSGLMMSEAVDTALDLGTGCGIQALHAARHARRVVATDISERALAIAAFNARLNGVQSIEFRLGSLYEPVAGERFDHIVSNPPFVITPRSEGVPEYEYRDGGMVGDALVREVVRGAADHLVPGGVAQLLGNWEYHRDRDAFDRVREWLTGTRLDAWFLEREVQDGAQYAETWIRDGGTRSGPEFDRLYDAWLEDFDARGVESVGFGYVTLRAARENAARGAWPMRVLERVHGSLGHNASGLGEHIAASLAARDWLAGRDDAALAAASLTVAGDVTEERHYWPGQEHPTVIVLKQGGGLGRSVRLDTGLAALVGACDGDLSVGAIIAAVAQLLEVDPADLQADLLPRMRDLVADGFLRP
ncbi:methyltransferase [Microbacteriaceae bacterium 4G12]